MPMLVPPLEGRRHKVVGRGQEDEDDHDDEETTVLANQREDTAEKQADVTCQRVGVLAFTRHAQLPLMQNQALLEFLWTGLA
jgi:hypothetical protein